jgi:Trk-type K+ transport system membrane component
MKKYLELGIVVVAIIALFYVLTPIRDTAVASLEESAEAKEMVAVYPPPVPIERTLANWVPLIYTLVFALAFIGYLLTWVKAL